MADQGRTSITKSVLIEAPVEKVFAYYTDPSKQTEFWPSMVDVRDIQYEDGRPASFAWTYKMAGMKFDGESRFVEYSLNRRVVIESSGGIKGLNTIDFEDEGGSTRIREEISYEIPMPLLGRFAEKFLLRLSQNEFEVIHANVKARMESEALTV